MRAQAWWVVVLAACAGGEQPGAAAGQAEGPPAGAPSTAAAPSEPAPPPALAAVIDGWARAHSDLTRPAAAWLTLRNPTDRELVVRAVQCVGVADVTIHETVDRGGGVMAMRPMTGATVEPRDSLVMRPGGVHLMLEGLQSPLAAGSRVSCTVTFVGSTESQVTLEVRAP